jgi:hypothetical protein
MQSDDIKDFREKQGGKFKFVLNAKKMSPKCSASIYDGIHVKTNAFLSQRESPPDPP